MASLIRCDNDKCNNTVPNTPYTLMGWFVVHQVDPLHSMSEDEGDQKIFCTPTCVSQWLQDKHNLVILPEVIDEKGRPCE